MLRRTEAGEDGEGLSCRIVLGDRERLVVTPGSRSSGPERKYAPRRRVRISGVVAAPSFVATRRFILDR